MSTVAQSLDVPKKKSGGLGRSELSYKKHDEIEKFMKRQLPVISKKGHGCIIDMNAGDGKTTPHPVPDLFLDGSMKTTPTLAIYYAMKYNADVILCEKNKKYRDELIDKYHQHAMIIGDNNQLMTMHDHISSYDWILVLNDPNGYGKQSLAVMKSLSSIVPVSDFIIVFNVQSFIANSGNIKNENHHCKNVRGACKSAIENQWMLNNEEWKIRLNKKKLLCVGPKLISPRMIAKILLVSNFIPGMK